ncbi:HupE/UreJ family protein [Maribacter sp. 2210JD10-5]|uniref:HupE/UreJ family protein n=1 Tax=Maribacter sp. 2210JD10-5 TaxID=3386272 RepID=UPI0039BC532B
MKKSILLLSFVLFALSSLKLWSHAPNQSYVFLSIYETEGIKGRFELNVTELNKLFGLNLTNDLTVSDLEPHAERIKSYLLGKSSFSSNLGQHKVVFDNVTVLIAGANSFGQFRFHLQNTDVLPDALEVFYNAVFEVDDEHRGFLTVEQNFKAGVIKNESVISLYFTPSDPKDILDLTSRSVWKGFVAMVKQGIWHIWIGLDHILFLLALILPAVVRRRSKEELIEIDNKNFFSAWKPVDNFKSAFFFILKVVTFFTIAHTITLTLASLELVILPSRLVESIIAFSIGLAAYHNIRPIFKGRDWVIAFIFGLFHGFGFASVLSDLGLTNESLTISLLGFNVGVEIGQLVIIAMIFPILYLIRNKKIYPKILLYGSIFLIIVSLYWCIERIFDIDLGVEYFIKSKLYDLAVYLGLK